MNLIPNNSFETQSGCPSTTGQITLATGWLKANGSPDFYSACATNTQMMTPKSVAGYQCPSTGNNYGAYGAYFSGNQAINNEILGMKLTDSLLIGTTYYLSFKLASADWQGQYSGACSHHGVKLSTAPLPTLVGLTTPTTVIVNNFAQFYTTQIIYDTLNWVTIKGSITADSNYKYINFGLFFEQSVVSYTSMYGSPTIPYYFIDDVCFSTDSNTCKITSQTCLPTNVKSVELEKSIYISPNPCNDVFRIVGIANKTSFSLRNMFGELVKEGELNESEEMQISDLPPALYFIELKNLSKTKHLRLLIRR